MHVSLVDFSQHQAIQSRTFRPEDLDSEVLNFADNEGHKPKSPFCCDIATQQSPTRQPIWLGLREKRAPPRAPWA